jgi:hypothetical protein
MSIVTSEEVHPRPICCKCFCDIFIASNGTKAITCENTRDGFGKNFCLIGTVIFTQAFSSDLVELDMLQNTTSISRHCNCNEPYVDFNILIRAASTSRWELRDVFNTAIAYLENNTPELSRLLQRAMIIRRVDEFVTIQTGLALKMFRESKMMLKATPIRRYFIWKPHPTDPSQGEMQMLIGIKQISGE